MDSPTSVPPGSRATTTGTSRDFKYFSRSLICVVLPDPSMPSKEINGAIRVFSARIENQHEGQPCYLIRSIQSQSNITRNSLTGQGSRQHLNSPPKQAVKQFGVVFPFKG